MKKKTKKNKYKKEMKKKTKNKYKKKRKIINIKRK